MRTSLKILISTTIGFSLLAAFLPQLYEWFALSRNGIEHFYLWQFFTYIFLEPGPLSLNFFLQLAFNMYILWMFGSSLLEFSHICVFLTLYFGSALIAGLAAMAFPHALIAGSTYSVYAIMIAWMMRNLNAQLLFFAIPIKAQWLITGLLGLAFFIDITSNNWIGCVCLAASVLFSYLFSLITWREQSPFPFLWPFEKKILRLLEPRHPEPYHHSKIYDIKSGSPILDNDQFMDAMLDQISRLGENSLTPAEKKRMKEISEKKK